MSRRTLINVALLACLLSPTLAGCTHGPRFYHKNPLLPWDIVWKRMWHGWFPIP
jgi:hypothetical protein